MATPSQDDLLQLRQVAIDGMTTYMKFGAAESEDDPEYEEDFDAGYTQADIDRCAKIMDEMLASLESLPPGDKNDAILKTVKSTVLKLNKLNERCDGMLIETEQREQLCTLIIAAAQRAGLVSTEHDITEPWREW